MSVVHFQINGRPYQLACDPGEEGHVLELSQEFDSYVRALTRQVGHAQDNMLFLMAALTMADRINEQSRELALLKRQLEQLQKEAQLRKVSKKANDAGVRDMLEGIAERLDHLVESIPA